jgi:hypothetical protein
MLQRLAREKNSSLLQKSVNYNRKKFLVQAPQNLLTCWNINNCKEIYKIYNNLLYFLQVVNIDIFSNLTYPNLTNPQTSLHTRDLSGEGGGRGGGTLISPLPLSPNFHLARGLYHKTFYCRNCCCVVIS